MLTFKGQKQELEPEMDIKNRLPKKYKSRETQCHRKFIFRRSGWANPILVQGHMQYSATEKKLRGIKTKKYLELAIRSSFLYYEGLESIPQLAKE